MSRSQHQPRTPAWPPRSAPRLFVSQRLASAQDVILDGAQAHYLGKVMRARPGDTVILCDNQTGAWQAQIIAIDKRRLRLAVGQLLTACETVPDYWLCAALLKKDRFDLVLEKATELGVARIQPVITRRCVADKLNHTRALAIMTEAAEQCTRTVLPELAQPIRLDHLLNAWPEPRALFFADEQGGKAAASTFANNAQCAALLTGPEGGFDAAERASIKAVAQVHQITLGPRILRGETAAIAATALWMGTCGDWQNDR